MADRQGHLRGLTFADEGDLLAITREGDIRRYRDVDHDGLYGDGAPETVVWASTGGDNGYRCALDGGYLYCGSKDGVKRWRYRPELDHGGPGEDVLVGMGESGRDVHPLALRDGYLYATHRPFDDAALDDAALEDTPAEGRGDPGALRRFSLSGFAPGKPMRWADGERVVQGPGSVTTMARARPSSGLRFALAERWHSGVFVALRGSHGQGASVSTGHKVVWIGLDPAGVPAAPAAARRAPPAEVVFGGGRYGAPRDGAWRWSVGDAGEDPVRPVSIALSPLDGALYVASDNGGDPATARSGAVYRIALVGR